MSGSAPCRFPEPGRLRFASVEQTPDGTPSAALVLSLPPQALEGQEFPDPLPNCLGIGCRHSRNRTPIRAGFRWEGFLGYIDYLCYIPIAVVPVGQEFLAFGRKKFPARAASERLTVLQAEALEAYTALRADVPEGSFETSNRGLPSLSLEAE